MSAARKRKRRANPLKAKAGSEHMAKQADRHRLYELSVQNTEGEYEFIDESFRRLRGRPAHQLREDFCGTANMCCEWVRADPENQAVGVDLDPAVLEWGRENNISRLDAEAASRVTLLQENVLKVQTEPVDVIMAMNFSYQIFKQRDALRDYFSHVRKGLKKDGIFFLDAFGGYEAFQDELSEKTKNEGFTYIWDQARFNPITGDILCHIHFAFPDGSRMDKAFSYDWRLWTLPELQEILKEAGFSTVTVYWQQEDEDGEPSDEFLPTTVGEADPGWICYLSAEK